MNQYTELREMAIRFASDGKMELAIGAVIDALKAADFDPFSLAYFELRKLAEQPDQLPTDPSQMRETIYRVFNLRIDIYGDRHLND